MMNDVSAKVSERQWSGWSGAKSVISVCNLNILLHINITHDENIRCSYSPCYVTVLF